MEAKLVQLGNKGMYKDYSISKAVEDFAYHNKNIRITPTTEESLLSITNEVQPVSRTITGDTIVGNYVGHCIAPKYLILFTSEDEEDPLVNHIYKINENLRCTELYHGNIGMSSSNPIETLFYYESEDIQKVYWIDGVHQPRFINIVGTYQSGDEYSDQFNFVPNINKIPTVEIIKNFDAIGNFHSGTIQYLITYYNKFGSETGIVWSSPICYISPYDRGGSPDEFVSCSFNLKISDIDTSFDYIKIYSIKRQSIDGPIEANIVKDLSVKDLDDSDILTIIDDGQNQPTVDPNIIYFLGGSNFIPETFDEKDGTLFFGNIKVGEAQSSGALRDFINTYFIDHNLGGIQEAKFISYDKKIVATEDPSGFYPFMQQINLDSLQFKGFKRGEIYRFAIQYQNAVGSWTEPIWIGDKRCDEIPSYDLQKSEIGIPTAKLTISLPEEEEEEHPAQEYEDLTSEYIAYRILIAETDYSSRSIVAQGIISPTIFNYKQRLRNKPFAIASPIMRPRNSNAEFNHFYPLGEEIQGTGSLLPKEITESTDNNTDIISKIIIIADKFHDKYSAHITLYAKNPGQNEVEIDANSVTGKYVNYRSLHKKLEKKFSTITGGINLISQDSYYLDMLNGESSVDSYTKTTATDTSWKYEKTLSGDIRNNVINYITKTSDINFIATNYDNEYYVDESIVTFNSPDLLDNFNQIDQNNLKFRIVGIAPITSSRSDFSISLDSSSITKAKGEVLQIPEEYINNNLSTSTPTLLNDYLYLGPVEKEQHDEDEYPFLTDSYKYKIYMWHKSGSIPGLSYKDISIDTIDTKKFATERFSIYTEYLSTPEDIEISTPQIFNYDNIAITKLNLIGEDVIYYGNYKNAIIPISDIEVDISDNYNKKTTTGSTVDISFNEEPHAVFSLFKYDEDTQEEKLAVLPKISSDADTGDDYLTYSFLKDDIDPSDQQRSGTNKYSGIFKINNFSSAEQEISDKVGQNKNVFENSLILASSSNVSGEPEIIHVYKLGQFIEFTPDPDAKPKWMLPPANIEEYSLSTAAEKYVTFDDRGIFDYNILTDGTYVLEQLQQDVYKLSYIVPAKEYNYKRLDTINGLESNYPYLFIGELYKEIPYDILYGGYDENALENIKWITSSGIIKISDNGTDIMEGDTYYQRWDCVKTLPASISGKNQVVDITSVMLESHICLDGRYDRNRGNKDILNVGPTNFNLFNTAYNQNNNLFSYNILDSKYNLDNFSNQVMWSLQKDPTGEVDTWTKLSQLNSIYLDGEYGNINKIINYNDTITAFQDKAISVIKFNNDIQISTESGAPIEVVNSNKVTGYQYLTTSNGCHNKWSIHKTANGLYFIDDYNKSFFRINKDGFSNLSLSNGFKKWFADNVSGDIWPSRNAFRVTSDDKNNDVYIIRDNTSHLGENCLCYNESTASFTSFYTMYDKVVSMINFNGRSLLIDKDLHIKELFSGSPTRDFSLEYKVNPEPLYNKIFTNVEYACDTINNGSLVMNPPFKRIDVTTEYQSGSTDLTSNNYPSSNVKFRFWRGDVPRDGVNKLDRIQNPWINMKLVGNDNNIQGLTTLHNLTVKYFK